VLQQFLFFWTVPKLAERWWPSFLQLKDELKVDLYTYMVVVFLVFQLIVLISGNLYFFFCYKVNHPFFERYKSVDEPWPWQTDREEWNRLFWRSIKLTAFNATVMNYFLGAPFVAAGFPVPFRADNNFSSPFTLFLQFMFCNMVENLLFYIAHTLLHKPYFYKMIHKIHHEHKVTTSIATIYAHPVEYLFGNAVTATLGCLILGQRMHMSSYFAWGFWRNCEALYGHSGYAFSWNPFRLLPFHSDGREHPFHHSENVGNYSSTTNVWDFIYGTNSAFRKQVKEL
jgi:sterol desaturase/sphingolipid hydroxylase (fatty acid hydroxylase superfamily)